MDGPEVPRHVDPQEIGPEGTEILLLQNVRKNIRLYELLLPPAPRSNVGKFRWNKTPAHFGLLKIVDSIFG